MEILSKITPAETLLIKSNGNAILKDLLKYTFMDLLLKKVLEVKEIDKKDENETDENTYVVTGENFNNYKPKDHESILINPFLKSESIEILLEQFIKMVYESSSGAHYYRVTTKRNQEISTYFKSNFFAKLFGSISLNEEGKKLRKDINDYLGTIDKSINDLLKNDKKKALKLLAAIRGNIFLLKKLDFKLLKQIDKAFLKQDKRGSIEEVYDFDMMWLYMDFFDDDTKYDTYFESFDDAFDSADSSSGCSSGDSGGDSGCSGCGGCGGGD